MTILLTIIIGANYDTKNRNNHFVRRFRKYCNFAEKQTIEVLNNIVNYEKELEFKKNKNKRYSTMVTFRFPFNHNYDIENDTPKSINKDMYNDFIGYISEQGTENIKRQFYIEYDTTEKTLYTKNGE